MFYKCVNSFSCCNSSADNTIFTETELYLRNGSSICIIRLIAIFYCDISGIKRCWSQRKNYWDERINHDNTWELIIVIESLKGYYDTVLQFVVSALFGMVTLLSEHNSAHIISLHFSLETKKIYTSFICRVYRSFLKELIP